MAYADPIRIVAQLYALLGDPGQQTLHVSLVHAARMASGMEILRAVAANPENGYHGSLCALVTVAHNAFLPAHDGEPGIPVITPFTAGAVIDGLPADPDEIDSYRVDPAGFPVYSGETTGTQIAHDQPDGNNEPSPVAGYYSIVKGRFKFTGISAQVPLIQLTRAMADSAIPDNYEPTVVKLSLVRLVKPQHDLWQVAQSLAELGQADLQMIRTGQMEVPPIPDVFRAQKEMI